jgi:hypothetical protein
MPAVPARQSFQEWRGHEAVTLTTMTHWRRFRAALKGEETGRVPLALWRHWPPDDETPNGLAAVMLRWQQTYDFDFVKLTPTGTYGIKECASYRLLSIH